MDERESLHVVLGTVPRGLAVARHLAARRERVRAVNRSGRADVTAGVEVLAADVADVAEVTRACDGAAVVYHCANPPYAKWPELHPPLMESIIDGAAAAKAKLVFGDNLYAYGPVVGPLTEELPSRASMRTQGFLPLRRDGCPLSSRQPHVGCRLCPRRILDSDPNG